MTDPGNEKILGTLTPAAWRGFSVERVAAQWYALGKSGEGAKVRRASQTWHADRPWTWDEVDGLAHLKDLEGPLDSLIHEARQSSGSIGGEHRRDLKETIIGAPVQRVGIGVPVAEAPAGNGGEAKPKRGL